MTRSLSRLLLTLIVVIALRADVVAQESLQQAPQRADRFDFGTVGLEDPVEHTFYFQNNGPQTLEIDTLNMQPPLVVTKAKAQVPPGTEGSLTVRLQTPRETGEFRSPVVVNFANAGVASLTF